MPYIGELVSRKIHGAEKSTLESPEFEFHQSEYERLLMQLESSGMESTLPDQPVGREALNDLLVRIRLPNL